MQNNDKKVLLRISNLKQYFPLKGGRFVKANDGISLDIYEGETFGLVGQPCEVGGQLHKGAVGLHPADPAGDGHARGEAGGIFLPGSQ